MSIFQSYDFFRLEHYKKRNPNIHFEELDGFTCSRFKEVEYFNYIFFKNALCDQDLLHDILENYVKSGIERVKLIVPLENYSLYGWLADAEKQSRGIVTTWLETEGGGVEEHDSLLKEVQTWEDLMLFTKIYLQGFGSCNRNYVDVALNFKALLESDKVQFFLIMKDAQAVGICKNYYGQKRVFLAGCTILEPYRNMGLQKASILARVKIANERKNFEFQSWAYESSISHSNMAKLSFTDQSSYVEYVSKPLGTILRKKRLLSE